MIHLIQCTNLDQPHFQKGDWSAILLPHLKPKLSHQEFSKWHQKCPFLTESLLRWGRWTRTSCSLHFPQMPGKNFQGISTCIPTYSTCSHGKAVGQVQSATHYASQADSLKRNRKRLLRGWAASCKEERNIWYFFYKKWQKKAAVAAGRPRGRLSHAPSRVPASRAEPR